MLAPRKQQNQDYNFEIKRLNMISLPVTELSMPSTGRLN